MAVAFFLPVSSCSYQFAGIPSDVNTGVSEAADTSSVRYRYPYKMVAIDNPSSLPVIVAFLWPLGALFYRKRRPRKSGIKLTVLEGILCLISYWAVWSLTYLNTAEIGAIVAYCGVTLYLIAVISNLADSISRRRSA